MAASNEVLLVRHGETDDTAADRHQRRMGVAAVSST
jgi:broad specificity phosphatase PhoE